MFLFKRPKIKVQKRSDEAQEVLDKIEAYMKGAIDEPIEILVRFWAAQATVFTYKEIREILKEEELPDKIVRQWQQDYSKLVTEHLEEHWKASIEAGAKNVNVVIGSGIDLSEKHVMDCIKKHGAEFVTRTTQEQKDAIKVFLKRSVKEKMGTDELARLIRPCVGLTKTQAEATLKHYNTVKETLKEGFPKMRPATIERRAKESSIKYAEKKHRERAKSIAQTETARAYNKGADMAILQAQEQGEMGRMKRVWITSGDTKVCEVCRALNGMEIAMDEEFDSLFGSEKGKIPLKLKRSFFSHTEVPPAHPHCACGVMYEEVD